jgi:ribose 5-phosphate isomerase B
MKTKRKEIASMNIVIASDGSGLILKEAVKKYLSEKGYNVIDVGQQINGEPVTHINAARNLAKKIRAQECQKGIIICGTGAGASISMNKLRGMYCVACESVYTAQNIALINNANVLAMGGRVLGPENACQMAEIFLQTEFSQGFNPARRQTVEGLYKDLLLLEEDFCLDK